LVLAAIHRGAAAPFPFDPQKWLTDSMTMGRNRTAIFRIQPTKAAALAHHLLQDTLQPPLTNERLRNRFSITIP
jgi:hypothetical protein